VANAAKGGDGEGEEGVVATAALPQAVAPVEAPSVYCCDGERSVYCCGGAEESNGGDGEEEKDAPPARKMYTNLNAARRMSRKCIHHEWMDIATHTRTSARSSQTIWK
jgi:hypothetical protein